MLAQMLGGKMFEGVVRIKNLRLTKHAPDAGESARFQAFFFASAFSNRTACRRPPQRG
jgi:hypothetical protein